MSKLKTTFYELGPGGKPERERQEAIARLFGLDANRVNELWHGAKLTVDEFKLLGRCPADLVPFEIWHSERVQVFEAFRNFIPSTTPTVGNFTAARANGWFGLEEDSILAKPANLMTPFIRVRPRRLFQALEAAGMITRELEEFAEKCYRSNFTTVRFVATIVCFLMAPDYVKWELLKLLELGGFAMNSVEWVAAAKKHHGLVKVMKRSIMHDEILTIEQCASLLYLPSLACRDQYMTQAQFDDEVINRQRIPNEYCKAGNDVSGFRKEFKELMEQELTATGKLLGAVPWDTFIEDVYLKLPGGSTSLPDKIKMQEVGEVVGLPDSGNFKLSGNKRLRAELDPILHFTMFGLWVVYAFLKYEVAKVRYLYPADFKYTVLGLYIMDHMYSAFQEIGGIDMGHNVFGSISVKLGVLAMVSRNLCGFNCDGKGFNENHSFADMALVYDCCRFAHPQSDYDAYQELMKAIDHYINSLKDRTVILTKIGPVAASATLIVSHTLFSGEATTQLVNTMLLFGLAVLGARATMMNGCVSEVKLFLKGDDLNGFCGNWVEAVAILHNISFQGMLMEPSKDHVEHGHSEHERALVSNDGYNGSLMRRIGSAVAAEPQGSRGLKLEEMLSTMAEHHQSMICRGGKPEVVEVFSKAMLMTFMDAGSIPKYMWQAMSRPKLCGGFGLWAGEKRFYNRSGKMPSVRTRIKVSRPGKFADDGSANMTDPLLEKLAERFHMSVANLVTERDTMVGDSIESGLGPEKYGDRRRANVMEVQSFVKSLPMKVDRRLLLDGASRAKANELASELKGLLKDTESFRFFNGCTPEQVIERQLSRSGCVNAMLYKRLHGIPMRDEAAYIKSLLTATTHGEEVTVVNGLKHLPFSQARLFYEGVFDVTFWRKDERINTEVAAMIRSFVLQRVAESAYDWTLITTRQLNDAVKWEWVLTEIAEIVWSRNKVKLQMISF